MDFIKANQLYFNFNNSLFVNYKKNRNVNLPIGFKLVDENIPDGPITVNKENDDGTKRNLFNIVRFEKENNISFKYEELNNLNDTQGIKSEYFCELKTNIRPEGIKGYDISCPIHYTIKIDKAFYGRYAKDKKRCKIINGRKYKKHQLKIKQNCGYEPTKYIKELCEGKKYCTVIPSKNFFKNYCNDISKYLHINYYCIEDKELKKERISIVSFYNDVKVNSIQEHSISEFYQYSKIHGYNFQFENINYTPGREIYFMKFNTVIEKIIEGLKYKKYEWIFWVDSDVIILNPNIKLESFLPTDNKIHLIAAYDYWGRKDFCCGLNAGIFFIRVHEWSLNLLMRAVSYPYFNIEKEICQSDQTSLNNVLIESNEFNHYVIVPQQWFNNFHIKKGEFLYHIMGGTFEEKNKILKEFYNKTKNDDDWFSKTNKETREEVLNYYELPKNLQINIRIQP
eukprot:jgi/Orpsp1_1/1179475/evm.model.c7180000069468.1